MGVAVIHRAIRHVVGTPAELVESELGVFEVQLGLLVLRPLVFELDGAHRLLSRLLIIHELLQILHETAPQLMAWRMAATVTLRLSKFR
jgi:hypothetical protein